MSVASDWVSAVATGVGAVGTAAAFVATYRLLRREASRDEAAASARESQAKEFKRRQAANVACWYHELFDEDSGEAQYGAKILNASTLPIYDVSLQWVRELTSDEEIERAWSSVSLYGVGWDVIPPSSQPMLVDLPATQDFDWSKIHWTRVKLGVQMTFRDGANVRWVRWIDGTLDEDRGDAESRNPAGWEFIKVIHC